MVKIKKNSGFSLVELLVVISIISILSSIIYGSYSTARLRAADLSQKNYIEELLDAVYYYVQDHDGQVPPPFKNDVIPRSYNTNDPEWNSTLLPSLSPYLKNVSTANRNFYTIYLAINPAGSGGDQSFWPGVTLHPNSSSAMGNINFSDPASLFTGLFGGSYVFIDARGNYFAWYK